MINQEKDPVRTHNIKRKDFKLAGSYKLQGYECLHTDRRGRRKSDIIMLFLEVILVYINLHCLSSSS